jgi:hypothetical protein
MTTYPHRYGHSDRAIQHYATACAASAAVLRREGLPEQAADLDDAARAARTEPAPQCDPDHPGHRDTGPDQAGADHADTDRPTHTPLEDDDPAPGWWR